MKILYLFLFFFSIQFASAQKTIFSVNLNGGLSAFRGKSTQANTEVYTGGPFCRCSGASASSFGSRNGFSYGAGFTIQRQFRNRILLGMDLGYELLKTKVSVDKYVLDDMIMNVDGKNVSYNHFLNAFPHFGYSMPAGQEVKLSLIGGADFGVGLNSYDKMSVPDFFKNDYRNTDYIPGLDFRPRLQFQVSYHKTGFNVSYSYGLTNWMSGWVGGNPEAYMKVIRVGLQYQLN